MSGSRLLRLRVHERLEAAVEEIFGLVEKTIADYEEDAVRSKREIGQLKQQLEQLVVLKPGVVLNRADTNLVPAELPSSSRQHGIKLEVVLVPEETEIPKQPPIKEEQVEEFIGPCAEADASEEEEGEGEADSEPDADHKRPPSAGTAKEGVDVFVGLEQPPRGDKSCRFCGKNFRKDSFLIRHVAKSHKGHKAFKCMHEANLKVHTEIHESWKRHVSEKLQGPEEEEEEEEERSLEATAAAQEGASRVTIH
ncbi:hypothetical protein EYF80_049421 [Liparis tanakae]|uniref:C2H2-type domain-containing protein n=1 Tax=Liparis tanakae TaxID=230148 RepID=A0A4Z2FGR2_9TELE|nr:hypothetical protein EYF80_049421 [Liparis tanakae]